MIKLPETLIDVVKHFTKLPGVGEKTALRQVMSLSLWNKTELQQFATSLEQLADIKFCVSCGMFSDSELCSICSDDYRVQSGSLCVVENINDLMAIEKSGQYKGLYYVLGGVLNPLLGIGPDQLKMEKLKEKVQSSQINSIVLAINPSVEGDATCSYIQQMLQTDEKIEIERIGFGVPVGGSLEFLDSLTISKAFENRKRI